MLELDLNTKLLLSKNLIFELSQTFEKKQTKTTGKRMETASLADKLSTIAVEFNGIHARRISHSYIGRDLLRMYKKFSLSRQSSEFLEAVEGYDSNSLLSLFNHLSHLLGEKGLLLSPAETDGSSTEATITVSNEDASSSEQTQDGVHYTEDNGAIQISPKLWQDEVPTEQIDTVLNSFMEKYYGDSSKLVKVIMCVDQAFIVCLLGHLAESLFFSEYPMRFKDIRGTWNCSVIQRQNLESSRPTVSFVHRRSEQMMRQVNNVRLENMFTFTWELELEFDSWVVNHLDQMHVRLLNIEWPQPSETQDATLNNVSVQLSQKEKTKIEKVFLSKIFGKEDPSRKSMTLSDMKSHTMKRHSQNVSADKRKSSNEPHTHSHHRWFSSIFCHRDAADDVEDFKQTM